LDPHTIQACPSLSLAARVLEPSKVLITGKNRLRVRLTERSYTNSSLPFALRFSSSSLASWRHSSLPPWPRGSQVFRRLKSDRWCFCDESRGPECKRLTVGTDVTGMSSGVMMGSLVYYPVNEQPLTTIVWSITCQWAVVTQACTQYTVL
jgi:hypothetical protein